MKSVAIWTLGLLFMSITSFGSGLKMTALKESAESDFIQAQSIYSSLENQWAKLATKGVFSESLLHSIEYARAQMEVSKIYKTLVFSIDSFAMGDPKIVPSKLCKELKSRLELKTFSESGQWATTTGKFKSTTVALRQYCGSAYTPDFLVAHYWKYVGQE